MIICSLCMHDASPRHGIIALEGFYPLCAERHPANLSGVDDVAQRCKETGVGAKPLAIASIFAPFTSEARDALLARV